MAPRFSYPCNHTVCRASGDGALQPPATHVRRERRTADPGAGAPRATADAWRGRAEASRRRSWSRRVRADTAPSRLSPPCPSPPARPAPGRLRPPGLPGRPARPARPDARAAALGARRRVAPKRRATRSSGGGGARPTRDRSGLRAGVDRRRGRRRAVRRARRARRARHRRVRRQPRRPHARRVRAERGDAGAAERRLAASGERLTQFEPAFQEWVPLDSIPGPLVDALIDTEDRRFYEHGGVDLYRTVGALWATARGRREGGSTVTQQLARNLFPAEIGRVSTPERKVKEMIAAVRIEQQPHQARDPRVVPQHGPVPLQRPRRRDGGADVLRHARARR